MVMGSLVHDLIFDPDNFAKFWEKTDFPNRKVAGFKAAKLKALQENKKLVLAHEYETAAKISEAFLTHPWIERLISAGGYDTEQTGIFNWNDEKCKFKTDFINDDLILDLKTTSDSTPTGFGLSALKYGYLTQGAFYAQGAYAIDKKSRHYYMIAIESDEPHEIRIYQVNEAMMEREYERISTLMDQLSKAKKNGFSWKSKEPEQMWVPYYYFNEEA